MAVPDTDTFSLQDVCDQFTKNPPDDLVDCFSVASSAEFDPNYEGSKDRLSNFRNYGGIWVGKLQSIGTVTPGSSTSWSNQTNTLSSLYYGRDVRVVWKYTSGSSYTGDFQLGGNVTLGGTTFNLDTYSGTAWQTTRVDTAAYDSATFYNIISGTTALRWNLRSGTGTPSGNTGLVPPPYSGGNGTYYYTETSSGGSPSKRFWLRSPQVSISSGNDQIDWWRGNYGATIGSYTIYLEIMT